MNPERTDAILAAVLDNLARWQDDAGELERQCSCPASKHLAASIRQGRTSLVQLIQRYRQS